MYVLIHKLLLYTNRDNLCKKSNNECEKRNFQLLDVAIVPVVVAVVVVVAVDVIIVAVVDFAAVDVVVALAVFSTNLIFKSFLLKNVHFVTYLTLKRLFCTICK